MAIELLQYPLDTAAAYSNFKFQLAFELGSQGPNELRFLLVELQEATTGTVIVKRQSYPYRQGFDRGWRLDYGNDLNGHLYTTVPTIGTSNTTIIETSWRRSFRLIYGEKIIDLTTKTVTEDYPQGSGVYQAAHCAYQYNGLPVLAGTSLFIATRKPASFSMYRQQTDWFYFTTNGTETTIRVQRLRANFTVINTGVYIHSAQTWLIGFSIGGTNGHLKPTAATVYTRVNFEVGGAVVKSYLIEWLECAYDNTSRELLFLNSLGGYDVIYFKQMSASVETKKLNYTKRKVLDSVINTVNANQEGTFQYGSSTREKVTLSTEIDLLPNPLEYKTYLDDFAASNAYYITHRSISDNSLYYARFEMLDFTMETGNNANRVTITVVGYYANEFRTVEQR